MVVAYLRGLLKPSLQYGLRSVVAENYVLESLMSENQASALESSAVSDSAILSTLTMESKKDTMRVIRRRLQRATNIRNGEIYRSSRAKKSDGQISLYQLYQLCAKSGILETLTKADTTTTTDNE